MRATRLTIFLLTLLACLGIVSCASQPALTPGSGHVIASTNGLPAPDPEGMYKGVSEYRIGPLDLLTIAVLGVTELSSDVRVNGGGDISLPLIGIVHAGGKTVEEVQHDIGVKLADGFLQSPQVTVFIKEYTSQRVTVEGAVTRPGVLPLTGSTTLLQAIASSGGLTDLADQRGVVIFRVINGQKMGAVFDLNAIRHGAADDPRVYGNDIVVVEVSGSKSKLRTFIQTVPAFAFFRLL